MNAAIRVIVRYALYDGIEVMDIQRGYFGLVNDDSSPRGRARSAARSMRAGSFCVAHVCRSSISNDVEAETMMARKCTQLVAVLMEVVGTVSRYWSGKSDHPQSCATNSRMSIHWPKSAYVA